MNLLIIGEQRDQFSHLKELLELTLPAATVVAINPYINIESFHDYAERWDLAILLPFEGENRHEYHEMIYICQALSIPVLCIVKRNSQENKSLDILGKGIKGVIRHDAPLDILLSGIRFLKEGGMYFDPKIAKHFSLLELLQGNSEDLPPSLTQQQWKIFRDIAGGLTVEEVANNNALDASSTEEQIDIILEKTNSKSRKGAIAKALYHGWISIP
ncbi:response regulator transcription factor [Bacillus infantis]|uniref:Response regulator transcription factor n=1 Tax=Bacillus infantis TaxID=324767 RepID=A0A5D4SFH0_9BACI|nr:response regulator transcription factor [Bacillus infantis]TYS60546.1 response regulator transcription factor [Bacillus infantis]